MQIHNVEQNSPEWLATRLGIPTASSFGQIITPKGVRGDGYEVYANTLIAELLCGNPVEDWKGNQWTERGKDLEDEAVLYYEMQQGIECEKVGFVTNYGVGCSPDRFVGKDGLLEIKSLKASTQVKCLINNKVSSEYIPQIQGQLYVTGRKWCDWLAYSPEIPSLTIRVERDEEYITKLSGALHKFLEKIALKKHKLIELGYLIQEKN